jgi:hypothetical protein
MMQRRRFLKFSLVAASLAAAGWPRRAVGARLAAAVHLLPGSARALPSGGLVGIDGRLVNSSHPWTNLADLLPAFQNSGIQMLRYPGRNVADAWDWQSGWLDPNPTLTPFLPPEQQYLQTIQNRTYPLNDLSITSSRMIFTPGMACRNLRLGASPNETPLAASEPALQHTLAALTAADQHSIAIDWIELGDGFCETAIWHGSLGQKLFAGSADEPSDYPAVAAHWSQALHLARPSTKIAFHGASYLTPTADPQVLNWNQRTWQALAQESAIDAMAVQLFLPASLGINAASPGGWWGSTDEQCAQYQALHDPQVLADFLTSADQLLAQFLATGAGNGLLQTRFQLVVSAFNLADPIGTVRHTWAHGLATAAMLNALLREPRVALAVLHNLTDVPHAAFLPLNGQFESLLLPPAELDQARLQASLEPYTAGPAARVAALFAQLMNGMQTATPLAVSVSSSALIWGWLFSNASGTRGNLLLANLTPELVWVDSDALFQAISFTIGEATFTTWQAEPTQFITGANRSAYPEFSLTVSQQPIPMDGQLPLSPYSLSTAWQLFPPADTHFIHLPIIQTGRNP